MPDELDETKFSFTPEERLAILAACHAFGRCLAASYYPGYIAAIAAGLYDLMPELDDDVPGWREALEK